MRGWEFTNHVCAQCFGRVLRSRDKYGLTHQCADCGHTTTGPVEAVCSCGATLQDGGHAGMHCEKNRKHKPGEDPAVFAIYDGKPLKAGVDTKESKDGSRITARDKSQLALL
ncbi:MAG TPA: hypothetical protein VFL54_09130 [Gammaproteobacteria bacterium]|nr:hypothetical protein [Gammaproteobacteria bacterium]